MGDASEGLADGRSVETGAAFTLTFSRMEEVPVCGGGVMGGSLTGQGVLKAEEAEPATVEEQSSWERSTCLVTG